MTTGCAMNRRELLALFAGVATGAACRGGRREVVVYTSVDQVFAEPALRGFTDARVRGVYDTEETKSTGVLNRLLAEADHPRADVFWSGDPVRPFSLIRRGLVEPYRSPAAERIPAAFKASDGTWTGFAARARVLLVNKDKVPDGAAPRSIRDLVDPRWRGEAAIASPVFGTTTIHVAALFATWGDAEARAFLDALKANGVRIAASNGDVKRLVAAGEVSVGLADTDDAHEAIASGEPVEVVYPDQGGLGTLVMPTVAVVVKGGPNPANARALVDHLVSAPVEAQLAAAGGYMPLGGDLPAAAGLPRVADLTAMIVDYGAVAAKMEAIQPWLRAWAGL